MMQQFMRQLYLLHPANIQAMEQRLQKVIVVVC